MGSSVTSTPTFMTVLLVLSFCLTEAKQFLVGGNTNAWKVPSSPAESLNRWAEANRFQIGDTLVWKINNASKDSVLQVTREDYLSCNTSAPTAVPEIKDGLARVRLERPGAYYFIGGAIGACEMGQRMIVVVMSPRSSMASMSPAPSPAETEGPVPAAVSGAGGLAWTGPVFLSGLLVLGLGL